MQEYSTEKPLSTKVGAVPLYYYKRSMGPFRIAVTFPLGSNDDPISKRGITHFVEHCVFNKTENFTNSSDLTRFIEEKGAHYNGTTYWRMTVFEVETINKDVEDAFKFLREVLITPKFDKKTVDKEREVIAAEIGELYTDPDTILERDTFRNIFGEGINVHTQGTKESIKEITVQDVKQRFSQLKDSGAIIVATGQIQNDKVVSLAEKYLINLVESEAKFFTTSIVRKRENKGNIMITKIDTHDAVRLSVSLKTTPLGHKTEYTQEILAAYLRDLLYKELRENTGTVYSLFYSTGFLKFGGYIEIQTSCDKKNIGEVIGKILNSLKEVQAGNIVDKDFSFTKNAFIKSLIRTGYTAGNLLNFDLLTNLMTSKKDLLEDPFAIQKYMDVDQKAIKNVAKKFINKENIYVNIVGTVKEEEIEREIVTNIATYF